MPCIYAHNSFGKEVQKMLPKPLKNTIRRHPAAFRIGLQGPDFLFFYHPLLKCKTNRSEERRVGKECRSRWSPYH